MQSFDGVTGALVDGAPDAVVVSRADGVIVLANRRAHTMFGYPPGALPDRLVEELVPEDVRAVHPGHRAAYLGGEHPPLRRLPLRGRRRDGTVFAVEVSLSAVAAPDGHLYAVAILRDDTAQREAAHTRAVLASIVQSSHDAITTTDLAGTVLTWNPGAERLYGFPAAAMIGHRIDEIIPPDRRVDETEIRDLVRVGGRVDRYRTTRLRADGAEIAVSMLASPLRDEAGRIIGIASTARDVSARERREAQVQAILDAAPDALLGVAETGRLTLVNAEAERLFGLPRHDLIGMPVDRLIPEGLPTTMAVLRTGGGVTPLDTDRLPEPTPADNDARWATRTVRRHDGATVPVEISCSALRGDSGLLIVAVVRNITDRLALQAEQQRLRAEADRQRLEARLQRTQRLESLGQLAGGVAHDFNNLLAVILNYAEFIVEDAAGTPYAADAEQIARAGRRGSDLTHQLLAFARRDVTRPRPLDLNTVLSEVEEMLRRSIGEHITLTTATASGLPAVVADAGQLEQVLVNLAVNARDAMPAGGRLTIDTATVDLDAEHAAARGNVAPGRYVRLRVSDTGTGMPQEVIDKAFEPFFTTKPTGQGTGLGLATVYGIVTQAGGTVQIYSEPGLGTTITVLLPASDAAPSAAADTVPDAAALQGHGRTVLLVEDEPALRQVTERMLVRVGYQVLTAADGPEALVTESAHAGPIDILLTDVIMPGMLGKDLADEIAGRRPGIAVLYMSGYAQPVLTTHGTLPADVKLLEKPFTTAELLTALHRA